MKNYFFQIISFLFVYFTQIHSNFTDMNTSFQSTMVSSYSTLTLDQSSGTHDLLSTSSTPTNFSSYGTSMNINISTEDFTSSIPITSSIYTASTVVYEFSKQFTSSFISTGPTFMPSQPINITVNLTYKYIVESTASLQIGVTTNPTVLASVQKMVNSSFNLLNFTINVTRVEIRSSAKTSAVDMLTDIVFQSSRGDCDIICIKNAKSSTTPTENFTLLDRDGSLALASAQSAPSLVEDTSTTTTTTVNYQKGESPPGAAGRLGMGLGITFIAVIIIGEIIYLYRKYGFNSPRSQTQYELPRYHQRLSV